MLDCDSLQAALAKMLLKGSNYSQVGDEIQEICVVVPVVGEQIATVGELHESTDDVVRKRSDAEDHYHRHQNQCHAASLVHHSFLLLDEMSQLK